MNNLRLYGGRLDQINLKVSLAVIGIFTIITLVSYFYELSRAGLLTRNSNYHPRFPYHHREARDAEFNGDGPQINRHPLHRLGSQIDSIKHQLRLRKIDGNENQEINIAVHLGKNDSYAKVNNTSIHAYQHRNTQPNFYTKSCLVSDTDEPDKCVRNLTLKRKLYSNATQVLLYQHEPGGYFMRDCFKNLAKRSGRFVSDAPLTAAGREEWDHSGVGKSKTAIASLYGGLSFGVCERVKRPCLYVTFLPHPITRILTLYELCSKNRTNHYCKVNGLHLNNVTLDSFIRTQKSSLFYKLLYNHRHCKLVGEDEICLPDYGTSFLLSQSEKKAYLDDIVENLERWFSIIGLVDHLEDSLKMFENALGLDFSQCLNWDKFKLSGTGVEVIRDELNNDYFLKEYWKLKSNKEYAKLREDLMANAEVQQLLHADLVIYSQLEKIFDIQIKAYSLHRHLNRVKPVQQDEKEIAERHLSRKMSEYESSEISQTKKVIGHVEAFDASSENDIKNDVDVHSKIDDQNEEAEDSEGEIETTSKFYNTLQTSTVIKYTTRDS